MTGPAVTFTSPAGTIRRRTNTTPAQAAILDSQRSASTNHASSPTSPPPHEHPQNHPPPRWRLDTRRSRAQHHVHPVTTRDPRPTHTQLRNPGCRSTADPQSSQRFLHTLPTRDQLRIGLGAKGGAQLCGSSSGSAGPTMLSIGPTAIRCASASTSYRRRRPAEPELGRSDPEHRQRVLRDEHPQRVHDRYRHTLARPRRRRFGGAPLRSVSWSISASTRRARYTPRRSRRCSVAMVPAQGTWANRGTRRIPRRLARALVRFGTVRRRWAGGSGPRPCCLRGEQPVPSRPAPRRR